MPPPPYPLVHAATAPLPAGSPQDDTAAPAGLVHSNTLFQGQRTIAIAHNGAVYRLQATRQGKLILTK